ncbi:dynamin GTPase [Ranunculus cassubicifolius]
MNCRISVSKTLNENLICLSLLLPLRLTRFLIQVVTLQICRDFRSTTHCISHASKTLLYLVGIPVLSSKLVHIQENNIGRCLPDIV